MPQPPDFEELQNLQTALEILSEEVESELKRTGLDEKMTQVKQLESQLSTLANRLGEEIVDWEPDPISKKPAHWAGMIGLIKKTRTNRIVDVAKFIEQYPFIAQKIAKIPVLDAESEVGKKELEPLVVKETINTYSVAVRSNEKYTLPPPTVVA